MAKQLFSNNANATINAAIDADDTTITLSAGKGALFSSPSGGDYELLTLYNKTAVEIVKVTARSGDVLTVVRGQEGTTGQAWPALSTLAGRVTKGTLQRFAQNEATGANAMALGGSAATPKSTVTGYTAKDAADALWTAATAVSAGAVILDGTSSIALVAKNDGTTGGSEPAWDTAATGSITADGTVNWLYLGDIDATTSERNTAFGAYAHAIHALSLALGDRAAALREGVAVGAQALASTVAAALGHKAQALTAFFGLALGPYSKAVGSEYCTMIGPGSNQISNSHAVTGFSLVRNAQHADGQGYPEIDYAAQETYIFSDVVNLMTALDYAASVVVPAGATFFPTEMGLVLTAADTVTVQPSISFGASGDELALLGSTATTKDAVKSKEAFAPLSLDGVTELNASVKSAATATALAGRFYWRGILVEDE
jgi:hypothetical protein